MADRVHVLLTTYNLGLRGAELTIHDLTAWLAPSLDSFYASSSDLPDLVAISVQEIAALHLALAGRTDALLQSLSLKISSILGSHADGLHHAKSSSASSSDVELEKAPPGESYRLVNVSSHTNVALFLFGRVHTLGRRQEKGVKGRIVSVAQGQVALGNFAGLTGNKGAAGTKIWVERATDEKATTTESFTFVACHLSAHARKLRQRIDDYARITSHLLLPSTPFPDPSSPRTQINDATHCFLFGDLNFRLVPPSDLQAKGALLPRLKTCSEQGDWTELVPYDQLLDVRSRGRAATGWEEAPLGGFAPTYKLKPFGKEGEYTVKRTPSWTDRILYSSTTDPTSAISEQARLQLHSYKPPFARPQMSDHLPVTLLLSLPPSPSSLSGSTGSTVRPVQVSPPASMQRIALEAHVGRAMDRTIGWTWVVLLSAGLGHGEAVGVAVVVVLLAVVWFFAGL